MKIQKSFGDKFVENSALVIVLLWCLVCLYPLWVVLMSSVSDPTYVNAGKVWLFPKGFTLDGYMETFTRANMMKGYWNTIVQTVLGTLVNIVLTIPAAYALSKPRMTGRNVIMKMIVFTMYFSGGLIPSFINMKNLGLLNTLWAIILAGGVSSTNLIIARTFFASSIPQELEDAAMIDGCGTFATFTRVVLPLSKAMISVILLYYIVGHWNNYTNALYYTPGNTDYWPLQMVLRDLNQNLKNAISFGTEEEIEYFAKMLNQVKYSSVVVASVPVLILYPFLQKYFEKGVMIGSVKG